jgi:hypothetical protein
MRKKRTNIDFSKHKHSFEIFKNDLGSEIRVDHFKIDGSVIGYIKFINTDGILSITGDYGNWIFCRPFIPSANGFVSDGYWLEKLKINSEQHFVELDFDSIIEEINHLIDHGLEDYGFDHDELRKSIEWFQDLLDVALMEDKYDYIYNAFRSYSIPDCLSDLELIPLYKKIPERLNIIFDAFDEICERLKNNKNEK